MREAEERAESLVAPGEAEFESILGHISEYEARERELYERLQRLESNGAAPEARLVSAAARADEAATRGSRTATMDEKPRGPALGANSAIPDLVMLLDSDDDSPGALRRLFGGLRRRSRHDGEEPPEG